MTEREHLVHLIQEYEENFKDNPSTDKEVMIFRKGMIFAWKLAILRIDDNTLNYEGMKGQGVNND